VIINQFKGGDNVGFNPKGNSKQIVPTPSVGKSGAHGEILTRLDIIKADVKSELAYRNKPLVPAPEPIPNYMSKRDYYIEWREAEDGSRIHSGKFSTNNIRHCSKLIISNGKRYILLVKDIKTDKVLWDRR
jgi:hypothetical protein